MVVAALFYNRTRELAAIRRAVASNHAELTIVYGRRGAGKSRLLREALADQRVFWYEATLRVLGDQLEDLTAALRVYSPESVVGRLESVNQALEALADRAERAPDAPALWVIDELPWFDQAVPGVATTIKEWWDRRVRGRLAHAKLFLAGSLVSWMRAQMLEEGGPLHNRRTRQLHLGPLDYLNAACFYPQYAPLQRVETYAVFGGMPTYLAELRPQRSLWQNVEELMLDPTARLAEEPEWYRYGDLRGDAVYASILRAIASGHRRPSDIARAVGRNGAAEVIFQLDRLREIGLVEREVPIHEREAERSPRALYRLADHYVAFWYRYVDRVRHLTAAYRPDLALAEIRRTFDQYVSAPPFEDVCREFLMHAAVSGNSRVPVDLAGSEVGSWWTGRSGRGVLTSNGTRPVPESVQSDQIDIVLMRDGHAVLVGECKWSASLVGRRELDGVNAALRRAEGDLRPIEHPWRALFARRGFTPELQERARDEAERLLLFTPDDLYLRSPMGPLSHGAV